MNTWIKTSVLKKSLNVVKWAATLGTEPQNFLGAAWIQTLLKKVPKSSRRIWALRVLSLSPHYFIHPESSEYAGMTYHEYLEETFKKCFESRVKFYQDILKPHLEKHFVVLDYGCGPGFLAKVVAPHVEKIYAVDISPGALACAEVLNSAPNVEYLKADAPTIEQIAVEGVDAVYCFAVVQHLSDKIFEIVLENFRRTLKPGGLLILHIQLLDKDWRTEEDWKTDQSLTGKLKYRYGLHCFGRTEQKHYELMSKHGFEVIKTEKIGELLNDDSKEVKSQYLLTARKVSDN